MSFYPIYYLLLTSYYLPTLFLLKIKQNIFRYLLVYYGN